MHMTNRIFNSKLIVSVGKFKLFSDFEQFTFELCWEKKNKKKTPYGVHGEKKNIRLIIGR